MLNLGKGPKVYMDGPMDGCGKTVKRIHDHLYKSPHFLKDNPEEYRAALEAKIECDEHITIKIPVKSKKEKEGNFQSTENHHYDTGRQSSNSESEVTSEEEIEEVENTNQYNRGMEEPEFPEYLKAFRNYLTSHSGGKREPESANNEMNQIRRMMEIITPPEEVPHYKYLFDLPRIKKIWVQDHV